MRMRVGMGAECVRAYALKEYVLSTVCRTIFCKQWYGARKLREPTDFRACPQASAIGK